LNQSCAAEHSLSATGLNGEKRREEQKIWPWFWSMFRVFFYILQNIKRLYKNREETQRKPIKKVRHKIQQRELRIQFHTHSCAYLPILSFWNFNVLFKTLIMHKRHTQVCIQMRSSFLKY
jgi:hypothetical protein